MIMVHQLKSDRLRIGTRRRPTDSRDPVEILKSWWTLQILLLLNECERRLSDLRMAFPGASANGLTVRMRTLEDEGLVQRHYHPPPAASHVYELTESSNPHRPIFVSW
ncbi:MAG TPA: winged helix-turn-helix transcriptional regulator [Sphingobium sp.]